MHDLSSFELNPFNSIEWKERTTEREKDSQTRTFVVVPHSYLEQVSQAGVSGDVENIQTVACERPDSVQVTVSAAALAAMETDANVGRGA